MPGSDDKTASNKDSSSPGQRPCPYCGGTGEVSGTVGDVAFVFQCPCSGGSEEAVRWLLGPDRQDPSGDEGVR